MSQFKCTRGKHSSGIPIQEAKEKTSNAGTELPRISDTYYTCRVWTQFDALAYVRYYLAIRGGDWEKLLATFIALHTPSSRALVVTRPWSSVGIDEMQIL